jgi:hypothetical protein
MGGVMADEMLRSIYSAADETIEALDRLRAERSARDQSMWRSLRDAADRLGDSSSPYFDPVAGDGPAVGQPGPSSSRRSVDEEVPYVALPQRTTHGGPFGPKVRQKLIAEALEKRSVW